MDAFNLSLQRSGYNLQNAKKDFDPYADKYQCCCGKIDSQKGSFVVGAIHLVGSTAAFVTIYFLAQALPQFQIPFLTAAGTFLGASALCVLFLFVGLSFKIPYLLIPFLGFQVLCSLLLTACSLGTLVIVVIVFGGFAGNDSKDPGPSLLISIGAAVSAGALLLFLLAIFGIFSFRVALSAFWFLRDEQLALIPSVIPRVESFGMELCPKIRDLYQVN